jgi:hypothetical protein
MAQHIVAHVHRARLQLATQKVRRGLIHDWCEGKYSSVQEWLGEAASLLRFVLLSLDAIPLRFFGCATLKEHVRGSRDVQ